MGSQAELVGKVVEMATVSARGRAGVKTLCSSGTLILMAISPLGLEKERVACTGRDDTVLRCGIKLWGFML